MGFPKGISNKGGLNKDFGNSIPADETSNINWQKGGQKVGNIAGRLRFGKSSVAGLNTGEWGVDTKTRTSEPGSGGK